MILKKETIERFGYDPITLKPQSNRSIVVQCPNCLKISERRRQGYHEKWLCRKCSGARVGSISGGKKPRKYLSETERKEAVKRWERKSNAKRLSTLRGRVIDRIASSLRKALKNKKSGTFRNLPYTRDEFIAHIEKCFEDCSYICTMCNQADLRKAYDIDHLIPLATAKTVEEVIELFALSNLGILCPDCNRKVKRDKIIYQP